MVQILLIGAAISQYKPCKMQSGTVNDAYFSEMGVLSLDTSILSAQSGPPTYLGVQKQSEDTPLGFSSEH